MLSTKIGNINLNICMTNASGCLCYDEKDLDNLNNNINVGAIVSKSGSLNPREGNPKPRLYWDNDGSINSMGLPNLGYKFYLEYSKKANKPYVQSIAPFSKEELLEMLQEINKYVNENNYNNYMIEINLSCPNLINKSIVGYNYELFEEYLNEINKVEWISLKPVIGLKLPPYYLPNEFDIISRILLKNKENIKFITTINSVVNGLIVDWKKEETKIYPKEGLGGIGGIYCKPTALANINNFYKRLNDQIQIIGVGGVSEGKDIFEMILCGASSVQVGTTYLKDNKCFERLKNELVEIIKRKGYKQIDDFKGKLKFIDKSED